MAKEWEGWDQVETDTPPRGKVARIYGPTGTGRTTLALTAPGPIAILSFSERVDHAVVKAQKDGKEIHIKRLGSVESSLDPEEMFCYGDSTKERAILARVTESSQETLNKFAQAWVYALLHARTVVVETDLAMWQLVQYAYFGTLKPDTLGKLGSFQYTKPTFDFMRAVNLCRDYPSPAFGADRNVIFVGCTRAEWKDNKKTNNHIATGKDDVDRVVDFVVRTGFDPELREAKMPPFTATFEKCFDGADKHRGSTVVAPTWSNLLTKMTGLPEEHWQ